jgi:putative PIN family toxin of toxin-antitoxin system
VRLVLDTNIFVSALISRHAPPAQLLDLWDKHRGYTLISHKTQLQELRRVAHYDKIRKRIAPLSFDRLIDDIQHFAVLATRLPKIAVSPDPDDDYLLAMAKAGKADLLVSGDRRDLLSLKTYDDIRIVTAREAWELLRDSA